MPMSAAEAVAGLLADPSFYLPEASLVDLADAAIAVGGRTLPVHSQLLSLQSGVLRELFRGERERGGQAEPVLLREPFSAFSAAEVAWFLRLAYSLDEARAEQDMRDMAGCLPAVLRLAHALDAPRLLQRAERHIANRSSSSNMADIVECIELAEGCQLDRLYTTCVLRLAARLCTPDASGDGLSQAAALGGLGKGTILLALGAMAEAAKQLSRAYGTAGANGVVAAYLPSEAQLAAVQAFDERRRCRSCGAAFSSRSKLFEHLHASGHEADQVNAAVLAATVQLGRGM